MAATVELQHGSELGQQSVCAPQAWFTCMECVNPMKKSVVIGFTVSLLAGLAVIVLYQWQRQWGALQPKGNSGLLTERFQPQGLVQPPLSASRDKSRGPEMVPLQDCEVTLDIFVPMTPKLQRFIRTHGGTYLESPMISLLPDDEIRTAIKKGIGIPKVKKVESAGVRFDFDEGPDMVHSNSDSVQIECHGSTSISHQSSPIKIERLSQLIGERCVLDFWPPMTVSHASIILGDPLLHSVPAQVIWADLRSARPGQRSSRWVGQFNTNGGVMAELEERAMMDH